MTPLFIRLNLIFLYLKEIVTRSSLETQRLELLSEISNLKLRQAAFERENLDLRDKLRLSELTSSGDRKQVSYFILFYAYDLI